MSVGGTASTGGASGGDMTIETRDARPSSELLNLRDLIEMIPGLVLCALADGSAEFANRAWQEYTGCSLEQLTNRGWHTVLHPGDVTKFVDEWSASAGEAFEVEARMRRADGQYHWFSIRKAAPVSRTHSSEPSLHDLITFEDINLRKEVQVKLQLSEARQQAFSDNSPNLIFLKDRQGRYFYANKEFKRALRLTEEQIIGKRDEDLFSVEQAAAFQANDLQVLETGARVKFEDVSFQEDGQHPLIVQKFPLFDADGEICAIGCVATDITELKQREAALRYSEEKHRLLVETAPDAIVSTDDHGAIQFANPATARIFGHVPTALIGKPLTVLMPEFMREIHDNGFRRYLATGQRHINWQGTELTALRKNGQEFPVEISFGELTRDGHKVFTGFVRDISKRRQAEDKVRASERDLSLIIETIPGLVWCAAPDGELDYLNKRILDYTGTSPDAWVQLGWTNFLHPDDVEPTVRAWSRAVASGEQYDAQCRLRGANGDYRWFHALGQAARDNQDRVTRWYGLLIDISERKNMEEALRGSEMRLSRATRTATIGEFAAAIAHEINQPLTAVVANGEACLRWLAAEPPGLAKVQEAATRIVRDGKEAGEIVRRIRALFKKASFETIELDLNEVMAEVLHLLGGETTKRRVAVEVDFADGLPPVVGDRIQLQQLIFNLLLNGIESMDTVLDRPKKLFISSKQHSPQTILVEIRDSGVGMEDSEKIFEAFFTTKENGMGMGLAVCRTIIDAHHGRLWAASGKGEGTTFSFTLPIQPSGA